VKAASGIQRALVGAVWLSAVGYLAFVMNFGLNLLLARLLFPKDFGQFALAGSLVELLSLAAGFSFSQGVIQMWDAPAVVETAYVLSLRLYFIMIAGAGVLAALLSTHFPGRFIPLFFALFVVRNLSVISYIYSAQLERGFLYNQLSAVRLSSTVFSIVVALGLAHAGAGVWSLLGREVVLAAVALVGARIATGWRYRGGYNAETARRLWQFGRQMLTMRTLETIWYRGDTALLGILAGTLALGFYDRARYLAEFGQYVVSFAAVQVAFPVYARLQDRPEALTYAYRMSHGVLIRLMLPFLIWLALLPGELVGLLYGAGVRWNETGAILPWFAVFGFLFPIVENVKVLLTGIGRVKDAVWIRLTQVVVAVPLLVPAIWLWGARGAAGVMVLSEIGGLVSGYRALRLQVGRLYLEAYLRPALAAVIAGATLAGARGLHLLPWAGRTGYIANLAGVAGLYAVCLLAMDWKQLQEHLWALLAGFRGRTPSGWDEESPAPAALRPGVTDALTDGQKSPVIPVAPEDPP